MMREKGGEGQRGESAKLVNMLQLRNGAVRSGVEQNGAGIERMGIRSVCEKYRAGLRASGLFTCTFANAGPYPLPSSFSRTPCSETLAWSSKASNGAFAAASVGDPGRPQGVTQDKNGTTHFICYKKLFIRQFISSFWSKDSK